MTNSLDNLRRQAKALKKAYEAGDQSAVQRMHGLSDAPKHADFLHVVAREAGFASWPAMKLSVEMHGMDRAAKQMRLRQALFRGEAQVAEGLLADTPDLAVGDVPLLVALYEVEAMRAVLARDPEAATRLYPPRRAMCHLTFSRHITAHPERQADMLAMAELLVTHGADVNDTWTAPGDTAPLSALYGAIGHVGSMPLAEWVLAKGADPNDGESLYHATELGHAEGVRLLLARGAKPDGTNALLRAMDFDATDMVRMLLEAGANPNAGTIPALHHAARRQCSGDMVRLLLEFGADTSATYHEMTPYGFARIHGNRMLAEVLSDAGAATDLSAVETQLARAADGEIRENDWIDMAKLNTEQAQVMTQLVGADESLAHIKRLVAMGFDANAGDGAGMTPFHLAGWQGLLDQMQYFLRLSPDMAHLNAYGGTIFSTILHGASNCPERATRDHVGCMRLILAHGVALPRKALDHAGPPDMAALLKDWADAHPGQVVAHGVI